MSRLLVSAGEQWMFKTTDENRCRGFFDFQLSVSDADVYSTPSAAANCG